MTPVLAFMLGILVAWGPSILLMGWLVYREGVRNKSIPE
jgi:hypothetical protein